MKLLIAIPVHNERKYVAQVLAKVRSFHNDILVVEMEGQIMELKRANAAASAQATSRRKGQAAVAAVGTECDDRQSISVEDIRHCAYRKWESAGRPSGDGTRFWLEAEQELVEEPQSTV